MGTTADKLNYLLGTKTAIKEALVAKGVGVSEDDTFRSYADKIGQIQSGGGESGGGSAAVVEKDVNFRDYDGTILYSYTKSQFLALSSLPELPTRKGLTCQGWNYTLEDAKDYVTEQGVLEIGATYITDDGKTRLYINIAEKGRMTIPLHFSQTVTHGVTIDWGDGSDTETIDGTGNVNISHSFANKGKYVITLDASDGCTLGLGHGSTSGAIIGNSGKQNTVYRNMLYSVEIGKNITDIKGYAFYYCYSLASVVIPKGVTSIGGYAFYVCRSLVSCIIPKNLTNIGSNAFDSCMSLTSVVIPKGVTSIGEYAFSGCTALRLTIFPKSISSISTDIFQNCSALDRVILSNNVKTIYSAAFTGCSSLSSIVLPENLTSILSYVFSDCTSLSSISIPPNVISIGSYAFKKCESLASVVIPKGVTSVGSNAFYGCTGVAVYDFSALASIPSLSATSAFKDIPSDCKIIVPDALYDEWIAASNWSTYASQIVKASEYNG